MHLKLNWFHVYSIIHIHNILLFNQLYTSKGIYDLYCICIWYIHGLEWHIVFVYIYSTSRVYISIDIHTVYEIMVYSWKSGNMEHIYIRVYIYMIYNGVYNVGL